MASPAPGVPPPLLEMRGITKRFPGVVALEGVSLHLQRGEVLALTGENGAGKSTLIKVLGGALSPDEGEILVEGRPVRFESVRDAKQAGIALIHQELMLAPNLDLAGNVFLGNEKRRQGLLSPAAAAVHAVGGRGAAAAGRPAAPARDPALEPHRRRDADGGDRQGARPARAPHRDGRADLLAHRRRVGEAVPDRPPAALGRHRHRLHLAPHGRGARPRGPGQRAARRQTRGRPRARGGHPRQDRGPDGGARAVGRVLPAPPGARRLGADPGGPGPPGSGSAGAFVLHRLPGRDPRLRRPRGIGTNGADADALRRDAGARGLDALRRPGLRAAGAAARRSAAAYSWPPKTASGTAWCFP